MERTPEAIAERAREVVKRGYKGMKIDPFGAGAGELTRAERSLSVAIIREMRQAVGPEIDIFVEAHARFAPVEAIRLFGSWSRTTSVGSRSPAPGTIRSPGGK